MREPGGRRAGVAALSVALVGCLLAAAALLGAGAVIAPAADARPAHGRSADAVALSVRELSPLTPSIASSTPQPLTITLDVTNLTATPLSKLTITGRRGAPLVSPAALDAAIAAPRAPDASAPAIATARPVTVDLPANGHTSVSFRTSTGLLDNAANICLCTTAGVYPLWFEATADGSPAGSTQTFLPAFDVAPATARIGWLWPLIDRPHRTLGDATFTDDDLAASVSGGRLDRALQAVDLVVAARSDLALTLVVDPELLDELAVMATGKYTVVTPGTSTPVPGTGASAARDWLNRFRFVLDTDPRVQLVFTPFADPDVRSLARAGLPWSADLPAAMRARLAVLLGVHLPSATVGWPVGGSLTAAAAGTLATAGTRTLLLDTTAIPPGSLPGDGGALAVDTGHGYVSAVTSAADVTAAVVDAVSTTGSGTAALPRLMAELAVRVAQDAGTVEHQVMLAPPRTIDAQPDAAAAAILQTTTAFWTAPIDLQTARRPADVDALAASALTAHRTAGLGAGLVQRLRDVGRLLPTVASLLGNVPLLRQVPVATQRAASVVLSEETAGTGEQGSGLSRVDALDNTLTGVIRGVFIVTPSSGSYTLASSNSKLPLTIENDLDYTVNVRVQIVSDTVAGFSSGTWSGQIEPHSKRSTPVPTTIERSGRIQVTALLRTASGAVVGDPDGVRLSVRSTALGRIGVIITVVAAIALVLALVRNFWRRYRTDPARPVEAAPAPEVTV